MLRARFECHEALAALPVLIVSGSSKPVVPTGRPVVGLIPKPVHPDEFVAKVKACLGASGLASD